MCECNRLGTDSQVKEFENVLEKYKGRKDNIMVVLQMTQKIFGYIPEKSVPKIAETLKMAESEIYGIISFYSFFTLTPKAKYNIDVCLGTACFVLGANDVLERILGKLKVRVGQMTPDGKWIVTSCRCLGCCGLAPAITINGEVYGKLKPEDVDRILDSFAD
ncbi:MAG TPA: NAD(P)H-dependent oxidoreductase subunit E [Clostridiales bacterium]|nr:NAD(P)H-dependent oxidoreductase subunit E [Clostridiales bacterium]